MVNYGRSPDRTSVDSDQHDSTHPIRFLRREFIQAYQSGVREANDLVNQSMRNLVGEVSVWADSLNAKLDTAIAEALNAVGQELISSRNTTENSLLAQTKDINHAISQHVNDTQVLFDKHKLLYDCQSAATKETDRCVNDQSVAIERLPGEIDGHTHLRLEEAKTDFKKTLEKTKQDNNIRLQKVEARIGRLSSLNDMTEINNQISGINSRMDDSDSSLVTFRQEQQETKESVNSQNSLAKVILTEQRASLTALQEQAQALETNELSKRMAELENMLNAMSIAPSNIPNPNPMPDLNYQHRPEEQANNANFSNNDHVANNDSFAVKSNANG